MYTIKHTKAMERGIKRVTKRGKNLAKLAEVLYLLKNDKPLPAKYRDHALKGKWEGCRECHIEPDWLLIYEIIDDQLVILATATGTHSDLL